MIKALRDRYKIMATMLQETKEEFVQSVSDPAQSHGDQPEQDGGRHQDIKTLCRT